MELEQGLGQISALPDFLDRSEFRYLDLSGLNQELREALAAGVGQLIIIPMTVDANEVPSVHTMGPDREMYMGEVSGAVLASLSPDPQSCSFHDEYPPGMRQFTDKSTESGILHSRKLKTFSTSITGSQLSHSPEG